MSTAGAKEEDNVVILSSDDEEELRQPTSSTSTRVTPPKVTSASIPLRPKAYKKGSGTSTESIVPSTSSGIVTEMERVMRIRDLLKSKPDGKKRDHLIQMAQGSYSRVKIVALSNPSVIRLQLKKRGLKACFNLQIHPSKQPSKKSSMVRLPIINRFKTSVTTAKHEEGHRNHHKKTSSRNKKIEDEDRDPHQKTSKSLLSYLGTPTKYKSLHKGSDGSSDDDNNGDGASKRRREKMPTKPEPKPDRDNYAVNRIVNCKLGDDGIPIFEVEWAGDKWMGHNTWEPFDCIKDCEQLELYEDDFKRCFPSESSASNQMKSFNEFIARELDKSSPDTAVLLKLSGARLKDFQDTIEFKQSLVKKIKSIFSILINYTSYDPEDTLQIETLVLMSCQRLNVPDLNTIPKIKSDRLVSLEKLADMRDQLNQVIQEKDDGPDVEIENHVDSDVFTKFNYIKEYDEETHDVVYHKENPVSVCHCHETCGNNCNCLMGFNRPYDNHGYLRSAITSINPIYECNNTCYCNDRCPLKVVTNGRQYKLCIFKTGDGRGWGLKTLQDIPKRKFVVTYTGHLKSLMLSEEEEVERSADSDPNGYLMTLDFPPVGMSFSNGLKNSDDNGSDDHRTPYVCIDAKKSGNVSRFINHSVSIPLVVLCIICGNHHCLSIFQLMQCEPNLELYQVYSGNLNIMTPIIGLFSKRDIKSGEELTFEYRISRNEWTKDLIRHVSDLVHHEEDLFGMNGSYAAQAKKSSEDAAEIPVRKLIKCLCGSINCRGYLR